MPTHREALEQATRAAIAARQAAMDAGHDRNSPEVERSGWKAADEVMRRLRPEDYAPPPIPTEAPDDPIFERMNR